IRTVGQSTVVALRDERRDYPFFLIHNQTNFPLSYKEVDARRWYKVPPRTARPFAFETHLLSKEERKVVVKVADVQFSRAIDLERASRYPNLVRVKEYTVHLYWHHRGATKVLVATVRRNTEESYDNAQTKVVLTVNRLGISLINQVPLELIYAWADQIHFQTIWSRNEQQLALNMNSFQIDNQMPKAPSSILFCGTPHNKRGHYMPWLDLKVHMYTQDTFSKYIQNFQLLPQVFYIAVDSASIQQLVNFFSVLDAGGSAVSESTVQSQSSGVSPMTPEKKKTNSGGRVMTEEEKDESSSNSVQNFLFRFGVMVLNIPEVRIPVSGFLCEDQVFDRSMLTDVLTTHYKGQVSLESCIDAFFFYPKKNIYIY
ncbi:hypothetical protein RFI_11542, partial [Reticulomyxa filosa]